MTWETNQNVTQLPAIRAGDIVHLKQSDGFTYTVKAIVSRVSPDRIEAIVDAIFDGAGQGEIRAGKPLELVGEMLSFDINAVHKVIQRNDVA